MATATKKLVEKLNSYRRSADVHVFNEILIRISSFKTFKLSKMYFDTLVKSEEFEEKKGTWLKFVISQIYQDYLRYVSKNMYSITDSEFIDVL